MGRAPEFSVSLTPDSCIAAALMIILVPFPWLVAWLLAVIVHEVFHCLAICLCGRDIFGVKIGLHGAQIQTENLSDPEMFLCAVAGPTGGLLLAFFSSTFTELAVCGVLQSMFNLLPLYPLDGGRALHALARMLFPEQFACNLCATVKFVFLTGVMILGVFAAFAWNLGMLPMLFSMLLAVRVWRIKIPCK